MVARYDSSRVLLGKLKVFEDEIRKRQIVANRYLEELNGGDDLILPHILEHNQMQCLPNLQLGSGIGTLSEHNLMTWGTHSCPLSPPHL